MSTKRRQTNLKQKYIEFKGAKNFRNRILCATLSGKPIRIDDIRSLSEYPGISDYEASLLRLVEKITNGCIVKISPTGTSVKYVPGLITGGDGLTHECPVTRSIGYFLEFLICLAPFCKSPLAIQLTGITNDDVDTSIDLLRVVTVSLYKVFAFESEVKLKVNKRGCEPLGGGEVYFAVSGVVKELKPIKMIDMGKIKRVRGVTYTAKCGPMLGNRTVQGARGILNNLLPDVYVHTDNYKGRDAGLSSGYGISLIAESTTGRVYSSEMTAQQGVLPEDLGKAAAALLLEEIHKGGCVDSIHQPIMLLYMCLCTEDVSCIRLGKLTQQTVECLREFKTFFGVVFKIKPDAENDTVLLSCLGSGYRNYSRKTI